MVFSSRFIFAGNRGILFFSVLRRRSVDSFSRCFYLFHCHVGGGSSQSVSRNLDHILTMVVKYPDNLLGHSGERRTSFTVYRIAVSVDCSGYCMPAMDLELGTGWTRENAVKDLLDDCVQELLELLFHLVRIDGVRSSVDGSADGLVQNAVYQAQEGRLQRSGDAQA
jgi:hypothetical protein